MRELLRELKTQEHLAVSSRISTPDDRPTITGRIKGGISHADLIGQISRAEPMGFGFYHDRGGRRLNVGQKIAGGWAYTLRLSRTNPKDPQYTRFQVVQNGTVPLDREERGDVLKLLKLKLLK